MAETLHSKVHVGKDTDHDLALNALLAGIALGKASAASGSRHWGPDTKIIDGVMHITMRPIKNG